MTDLEDKAMDLFEEVVELSREQQRERLDAACHGCPELRARVEELVAHDREAETAGFLDPLLSSVVRIEMGGAAGEEAPPDLLGHKCLTKNAKAENVVGDYELLVKIDEGGMGVVWRCRDHVLHRDLAMKIVHERHRDNTDFLHRFQKEALVVGELQHPGIVPIHKFGTLPDGRPYFVMKLVKGDNLAAILRKRANPSEDLPSLVTVLLQVAQTLAYAHARGVINRDLKPKNVMVGEFGEVQVMDWGLVKNLTESDVSPESAIQTDEAADGSHDHTQRGGCVMGTWAYMPPEQGNGRMVDRRSDVFGLGAILCEILTGKPPYVGPTNASVMRQARDADLEGAHARLAACGADADLIALARDCLSANPHDRPADASEVEKRLTGHLASVQERLRQTELERAAAQARAVEEERTRRVAEEKAEVERKLRQEAEDKAEVERKLRQAAEKMAEAKRREAEEAEKARKAAKRIQRLTAGLAASVVLFLLAMVAATYFALQGSETELARLKADRDRQEAERRLVAEQASNAIDKALTAAMGGDLEAAEQAIAEAERAGASTGQVRMLRGQIALHRGETQKALEHLEQAVRLLPESVAARGMLAAAHGYDGQWERYEKTIQEMEKLSPSTAEDYLFKGYAEATLDPEKGLESITKAFVLRPNMRIARLLRAEGRAYRAQDTDDLEQAEGAVEDTVFAKGLLGDNPAALWGSLNAHLAKAGVHEHRGEPAERLAELKLAEKDAIALKPFTALPDAVVYRWLYFREVDREDEVLEELRRASERTDHMYVAFCYALTLYRRGKPDDLAKALRVLEKTRGSYNDRLLPFVLAEHDWPGKNNLPGKHDWPARARKASDDFSQRSQDGLALMNAQTVLCLLGKKEAAVIASKALQKQPDRFYTLRRPPILRCVDYAAGDLTEAQLVKDANGSQWDECLAHYHVGMTKLAEGDREGARAHFDKVVKTRAYFWGAYDLSWVFLARLEKDPNWPPWIEAKRAK